MNSNKTDKLGEIIYKMVDLIAFLHKTNADPMLIHEIRNILIKVRSLLD